MQQEISVKEVVGLAKKYFLGAVIMMILGAAVSIIGMNMFVAPKYQSESQLLVNQQNQQNDKAMNYSEIQSNVYLINTYKDIITGQQLLSEVSERIGGAYSVGQIRGSINVSQSNNSQVFSVKVTLDNPENAQTVLSEIIRLFEQKLPQIFQTNVNSIYVVQPATLNATPVSPKLTTFAAIGLVVGLLLVVGYAFLNEVTDNTVKNDEFLQALGVTKLGAISRISVRDAKEAQTSIKQARRRKV